MGSAATIPLGPGSAPAGASGFNRAIGYSFGVHLVVVLFVVFAPRSWFTKTHPAEHLMTISLGGTVGPKTTGTTTLGGRAIEQVAPPPKHEVPIRPTPKQEAPPAPVKVPQPVAKPVPAQTPKPVPPPARPPVTGRQVVQGNTLADTGATGLGVGLTTGGGGGGGETQIGDFCCPEYLQTLTGEVASHWVKDQPERGTTTVKFTVQRSGAITDVTVEQSSGSGLLDRAARSALLESHLPPLPAAFTPATIVIHLRFPFNGTQ